jgi:hypothetical protein
MKLKDEELWKTGRANNSAGYGKAIYDYAEAWANLIEAELINGATLAEVAETTSRVADTDGITGFMYGAAVHTLAHVWEHGDELRKWHNEKYGAPNTKGTVVINIG